MPYARNRLSTLVYANGFTLWHYLADQDMPADSQLALSRYFKPANTLLRQGDIILVSGSPFSWIDAVMITRHRKTKPTRSDTRILAVGAADAKQQYWHLHPLAGTAPGDIPAAQHGGRVA